MKVAIVGRFQPFHWGHFEYLLEASRYSKNILVAITNPDDVFFDSSNDSNRSKKESNPFSFELRKEMIIRTNLYYDLGLNLSFSKCHFEDRNLLIEELSDCEKIVITIYDEWGDEKKKLLESSGKEVITLWNRSEKIVNGTQVRQKISSGEDWEHLVPYGTTQIINEILKIK